MQLMYWSISCVTLALTTVIFIMTQRGVRGNNRRRRFSRVLLSSMMLISIDIVWVWSEDNFLMLPLALDYVLAVSYYTMTGVAAWCCYRYSDRLLREPGSKKTETIHTVISLIPAVLGAGMAIVSLWTDWLFSINPDTGIHVRGPLFYTHLVIALFYLLIIFARSLARTIMQKNTLSRNRYLSITMYSCLIMGLSPMQSIVPQIPFLNLAVTIAAIHAYFFINTFEREQFSTYSQLQGFGKLFLSSYCVNFSERTLERISVADSIRSSSAYKEQKASPKRIYTKAMSQYVKQYVHPDDRALMREMTDLEYISETLCAEQPYYHVTYRHLYGDSVKWNRMFVIMSAQNDDLAPMEALICFMDVNQEQELLAKSDYYRNLFTNAATGAYQRIIQVNVTQDKVYTLKFENGGITQEPSGKSIAEHLEHFSENIAPEYRDEVLAACRKSLESDDFDQEISYGYKGRLNGQEEYGWFVTTIRAMEYEGNRLLMIFISDDTENIRSMEMLEQKQRSEQRNAFMVSVLSSAVEYRSTETGDHVHRVTSQTRAILDVLMQNYPQFGIDDSAADLIASAAALHDIGKIAIPDPILLKPGKLTDEEFEIMKKHTIYGCDLLGKFEDPSDPFYRYCYDICRYHHERYDGRGYPDALVGDQIPIWAQVVSIVDVYDALITDRCYKKGYPTAQAIAMINNGECGTFSPIILDCFNRAIKNF